MTTVAREAWTDERLDDFKEGMHREFDGVQRQLRQVQHQFDRVQGEIRELRTEMDARFDALNRNLFVGMVTIVATLLAAILAKGSF